MLYKKVTIKILKNACGGNLLISIDFRTSICSLFEMFYYHYDLKKSLCFSVLANYFPSFYYLAMQILMQVPIVDADN